MQQLLQLLQHHVAEMSQSCRRAKRIRQRTVAAVQQTLRSTESSETSHCRRTEKQTAGTQVDSQIPVHQQYGNIC